jgi:hypothetical protein
MINMPGWDLSTSDASTNCTKKNTVYEFTLSASGTVTPTQIVVTTYRSSTGPQNFALYSSVDGYTTALVTGSIGTSDSTETITVSGVSAASVTFKIAACNAGSAGGTFRLVNPLTITGTVQ